MGNLPPHLVDEEAERAKQELIESKKSHIGRQGPSKYGPGGRRVAKAKGRSK